MAESVLANDYRRALAKQAQDGTAVAQAAYMAFGNGGLDAEGNPLTPDPERDGLNNQLLEKAISKIQEDDFSMTATGVVAEAELNGYKISEAVLLDTDHNPMAFKNFAGKEKEADEIFEVKIKLIH